MRETTRVSQHFLDLFIYMVLWKYAPCMEVLRMKWLIDGSDTDGRCWFVFVLLFCKSDVLGTRLSWKTHYLKTTKIGISNYLKKWEFPLSPYDNLRDSMTNSLRSRWHCNGPFTVTLPRFSIDTMKQYSSSEQLGSEWNGCVERLWLA